MCRLTREVHKLTRGIFVAAWVGSLALCATCHAAGGIDLHLHVTWGGGEARLWQGSFKVNSGRCEPVRNLGMESDAPTATEAESGGFRFWQHNSAAFDGFVIRLQGPDTGALLVQMKADGPSSQVQNLEIPISNFTSQQEFVFRGPLADGRNTLVVRRAPGDALRVQLERDSLVFSPGEALKFRVEPNSLGLSLETPWRLVLVLKAKGAEAELWRDQHDLVVSEDGSIPAIGPLSVAVPEKEGVFELTLSLQHRTFVSTIGSIVRPKEVLQRKVQFVVIAPAAAPTLAEEWRQIDVMELTSKDWWQRWNWLPHLKRLSVEAMAGWNGTGALGSDALEAKEHGGQSLTQLKAGGWYAAPIPIGRIDQPHLLELEYPTDLRQTLGISILETNAANELAPLGVDSGVDVPDRPLASEKKLAKHRVLFWPRTKTPWLLLTNRRDDGAAVFGTIRVLSGPERLPVESWTAPQPQERMLALYYDKPLFPENFSAPESLDAASNRSLEDWSTFLRGGERLTDYIKYAGYNAAVVSVLRDGGAIYPSTLIPATPKYDTGAYFVSGQDPVQKDVLEMLYRLFDREGLRLVPALQLTAPLPELQNILRAGGAEADGVELSGTVGSRPTVGQQLGRRGASPYYNPLEPRVQAAVARVVDEIAKRYSHHRSFCGICLQLTPESFLVLPDETWPCDDRTLAAFQKDTGLRVPGEGAERYVVRSRFLTSTARDAWLSWRAASLARFYVELQSRVAGHRSDARVFLAAEGLLTGRPAQTELRPRLFATPDMASVLLRHGLQPAALQGQPIVMLRPQRQAPVTSLAAQSVNVELQRSRAVDACFPHGPASGSLTYHEPLMLRLEEFDRQSPFGAERTHSWLVSHFPPVGEYSRANLVHDLAALDSQFEISGGWVAPLGQEDSSRNLHELYRQLPNAPFRNIAATSASAQGSDVSVRTLVKDGQTYLYVANDSPWNTVVELELNGAAQVPVRSLGKTQLPRAVTRGEVASLTLDLQPFDVVAAAFQSPELTVRNWCVSYRGEVEAELGELVNEVKSRVNELRRPQPLDVLTNPSFEAASSGGLIPGWSYSQRSGIVVETTSSQPRGGKQCLHVRVDDGSAVAWVRSKPFAPPKTGRVYVLAWIRTRDARNQPPLRLAIDGSVNGEPYYRFAPLGTDVDAQNRRPTGQPAQSLTSEWAGRPFLLPIDDLPATGVTELLVGFDLMGPGEVWIDDVQVFDLYFQVNEQDELLKNAALASYQLENGKIAECAQYLNGYWPRFLLEHVPSSAGMVNVSADRAGSVESQDPSADKPEAQNGGWNRFIPKVRMPFRKSGKAR